MIVAITQCWMQDGIELQKVVGLYEPDKVEEGINEIKRCMKHYGYKLLKDEKDQNGSYYFEYESSDKTCFYTGTFELNELSL